VVRRRVIAAWLGFALAALFFYPLAAAIQTDIYYLQWQRQDLVETLVALAVMGALAAWAIFALWPRSGRGATLALVAVAALPMASLASGVARQVPFEDDLRLAWENRLLVLAACGGFVVLVAAVFAVWPVVFDRWLRRAVIAISPVSLVVAGTLVLSAWRVAPVLGVDRESPLGPPAAASCAPVVAWLFDELSFSYLYDENDNVREEFPAIRRFSESATHYLDVAAPARETLVAMPSFLTARRLRDARITDAGLMESTDKGLVPLSVATPDGLFATARRLGFRTEMAGYYLPYCDLLGDLVDACRSLSFYNVSTARARFSPDAAVATTLVLWPRQFPFGLLKNPPFASLQRDMVQAASDFARRPLPPGRPVFRFVHFSVPHLPFAFGEDGYDPPMNSLRTMPDDYYVRQLRYVDRLFGTLAAEMGAGGTYDSSTLVLLADHGYRFGGRERDVAHIPFIVKRAGQSAKTTDTLQATGEMLLKRIVEDSCRLGPP
jgi:hypothetical protein